METVTSCHALIRGKLRLLRIFGRRMTMLDLCIGNEGYSSVAADATRAVWFTPSPEVRTMTRHGIWLLRGRERRMAASANSLKAMSTESNHHLHHA